MPTHPLRLSLTTALVVALLSGCAVGGTSSEPSSDQQSDTALPDASVSIPPLPTLGTAADLAGKSAEEVINLLERAEPAKKTGLSAVVHQDALNLGVNGAEKRLPLPSDRTYLALAPYAAGAPKACTDHDLVKDAAEPGGQKYVVSILDDEGASLADNEVTTGPNGFLGFWLPREAKGTLTVTTPQGKTGEATWSTAKTSPTCLALAVK